MASFKDHPDNSAPLGYIDLLVSALVRHEKNLNRLIKRLERVSDLLDKIAQQISAEKRKKAKLNVLYI